MYIIAELTGVVAEMLLAHIYLSGFSPKDCTLGGQCLLPIL